jgi:thymidine phosphorylase
LAFDPISKSYGNALNVRKAFELFESREKEFEEFLEEYDFDLVRAQHLEKSDRKSDAAEVHLAEGNAVDLRAWSLLTGLL